jgi:hypothetical protein
MRNCEKIEPGRSDGDAESKMAKVLAPEDVRVGDYVAILHVVYELPSYLWCGHSSSVPIDEPVRLALMPPLGGVPLQVHSLCLPFLLVKTASGALRNLDVRRHHLARLDTAYAETVWKASKKRRDKQSRTSTPR